jgi:heat shock protein HslJ
LVFVAPVALPLSSRALWRADLDLPMPFNAQTPKRYWSRMRVRRGTKLQGQQLSGTTGCNSFTATISETGERVKIVNLSLTRKLCAPRQNETERAFVRALGQTEYLEKGTERLTFLSDKGEPLLVWTSDKQDNARSL